jgi:hypothetical protein
MNPVQSILSYLSEIHFNILPPILLKRTFIINHTISVYLSIPTDSESGRVNTESNDKHEWTIN